MNYGFFFLINFQFSHVSFIYFNLSCMDGHLYHCFCVILIDCIGFLMRLGWSGGAKVLSKLSVPGRPTSLDDSRARAYCACSKCVWGLFGHFFLSSIFSLFFLPLFGRWPDID